MALDNKIINFDINKPNMLNLSAKQYDTTGARSFTFRLLKDGQIFDLTGLTVRVGGTKADNTTIFNDCLIVDAKNGLVRLDLTTQMQVVAGNLNLELIIMQGATRLSTIPFAINIIKSTADLNSIKSSNEFTALNNALNDVKVANERIDNIAKLKEGSTTGDAELQDIRIAANGDKFENAGSAVRGQVKEINSILNKIENFIGENIYSTNLYNYEFATDGYYVSYQDGTALKGDNYSLSDFIVCKPNVEYSQNISFAGNQVAFYDKDKKFINGLLLDGTLTFTVPNGASYFRIACETSKKPLYAINEGSSATYTPYRVELQLQGQPLSEKLNSLKQILNNFNEPLSDFIYSKNLFDKRKTTDGYFVSYKDGTLSENNTCVLSDFIACKPNVEYSQNISFMGNQVAFYDTDKKFMSGLLINEDLTFVTPSNTSYFRISCETDKKEQYCINEGSSATYTPYKIELQLKGKPLYGEDIIDDTLSIKKVNFASKRKGDNLFNKENTYTGYVSYISGVIDSTATNYLVTDFINVKSNTQYTIGPLVAGAQTCFYDVDKKFVKGFLHDDIKTGTVTSPNNACYMRTTLRKDDVDVFAVNEGSSATYTPYREWYQINDDVLPPIPKKMCTIVDKNGNGDFTTLTEAVKHAKENDIIFVKAGIYDDEVVRCNGKKLIIIGEDRLNTIIQNGYNTYTEPPMEYPTGVIRNLTIYAYDGGGESKDPRGWKPYSLHLDNDAQYNNTVHIENCTLKSDVGYGVGIGLRSGYMRFDNCRFESRDGYAFYFHDSAFKEYADKPQYLTVKNCEGVAYKLKEVVNINSQKTESSKVYPTFINNTFVSDITDEPKVNAVSVDNTNGTATTVGDFMGLINFYKSKLSRGNNIEELNY